MTSDRPESDGGFHPSRRAFLLGLGVVTVPLALPTPLQAASRRATPAKTAKPAPRALRLYNPNTKERWKGVYHDGTKLLTPAHDELNWFLRDHHERVQTGMDPAVFDLMWNLTERYRRAGHGRVAINVHSAFRTPMTNDKLRSEGAALNSLHLQGMAVDVSVQGYGIYFLIHHAERIATGGLGFYRAGFVHLDSGKRRYWFRR
ncbi:MAG: DUF882 domain-containing protein [Bauldia litoralis]